MYIFLILLLWIYLLIVFKRKKLYSFSFIFGSVGMFLIVLFFFRDLFVPNMIKLTTSIMGFFGNLNGFWTGYVDYGVIFVDNGLETISLNVDYECSGFIECLVFVSLCLFFPVYNIWERIKYSLIGIFYIEIANIIRLFLICICLVIYGNDSFYIAHSIVGRLIFFALTLFLYFFVFTKAQIKKQKVGNFGYNKDNKDSKEK